MTPVFFKKKEEPMPTVDDFFVALGRSETVFAGLQTVPFDSQTAAFRVGVYANGQKFGVQGISLGNAGDTIDVPEFGPAGIYGAATTSPGMIGWSRENDGCQGASLTGSTVRAVSFFGTVMASVSGGCHAVRGRATW